MQSRLLLARQMLREDGVIFVSIDDNEVHNLRKLMDEVFGEENFFAELIWERAYAPKNDSKFISNSHDYVLVYSKSIELFKIGRLPRTQEADARYKNLDDDPRGVWKASDLSVKTYNAESDYPITTPSGRTIEPPAGRCWSLSKKSFFERLHDNRIWFGPDGNSVPSIKRFLTELKYDGMAPTSILFYKEVGHSQEGSKEVVSLFEGKGHFDGPKPKRLLGRLLKLANTSSNDLILDFFAGSGTSAHAVMQQNAEDNGNRKHIMVQIPELIDEKSEAYKAGYKKISDITIERVKRAGAKIRQELQEQNPDSKVDTGFRVFKLTHSNFAENLFTSDDDKSDAENIKALEAHLAKAAQMRLFDDDVFSNLVTEISLKNGFGLFYQLEAMTEFEQNKIYRLHGNGKSALLCLDNSLHDSSVESLKPFNEEQLIVSKSALDTSKKFSLQAEFKDNLWVV